MQPRIGLALGSGSARGLSHIGVLEVLQEEDIPIHCVAGTSIGAVVGALWATDAIEAYKTLLESLNWWRVMGFLEPALSRAGIFGGSRLVDTLNELIGQQRIEKLPVRYVAVATDADTGQEVRLFRGDVVQAVRASMAIPGLFTPIHWEKRWLIDGGVTAPVPIAAAKALGAEAVIAVNLNTRSGMHSTATVQIAPDQTHSPVAMGIDETVFSGAPVVRSSSNVDIMSTIETQPPTPPSLPEQVAEEQAKEEEDERQGGFAATLMRKEHGDEPPGLAYTLTRSIDWMQVALAELQMSRWAPDIVIEPQCGHVKLFDFDKSAEIIAAGRAAALAALPEIRKLAGR
jgi:NTE family protein